MRLDPEHVKKLGQAINRKSSSEERHVALDIPHLMQSLRRLSMWEGGLLIDSLMRAAQSRRLSREQRVLLALFVAPTEGDGVSHAD
jgi:hypothetical protein